MYEDILMASGLSEDEAHVYAALLGYGPQGAGALLSRLKGMKRGLLYKTLERLTSRKLVQQDEKNGKLQFHPLPPNALVDSAKAQVQVAEKNAAALEAVLPELNAKYHLSSERPVIRFFEGKEGLRELYEDKIASGAKELFFIRTARAQEYRELFGTWFGNYLLRQAQAGIKAHALTVDDADTNHDPAIDKARNVVRTWLRPQDYTAPVQIDTYGDKVSILSFGKEVFGILIENAPLAMAIRQIFDLAKAGAETREVTHDHAKPKIDAHADHVKKYPRA